MSARVPITARVVALTACLVVLLGACSSTTYTTSFDPSSPCTTDGRMPGAYPDLEALLPTSYQGKSPSTVDSGRSCTQDALGTLATAGVSSVRFAGAIWSLGQSSALTIAVFDGTGLDAAKLFDFYVTPAKTASHTDTFQTSDVSVAGRPGHRLDVLNSDGTTQSVVVWPDGVDGRVRVLLASDLGDANVAAALVLFGQP